MQLDQRCSFTRQQEIVHHKELFGRVTIADKIDWHLLAGNFDVAYGM